MNRPTISRFYGIIIRMFYDDHMPPHFHAAYSKYELVIGISPITILEGKAPCFCKCIRKSLIGAIEAEAAAP